MQDSKDNQQTEKRMDTMPRRAMPVDYLRKQSLSAQLRGSIDESECTYGEVRAVLLTLVDEYQKASQRQKVRKTEAEVETPDSMREVYAAAVRNSAIHGDYLTGCCPFCKSARNNFSADLATGKWHCFDEGISGNYADFLKKLNAPPDATPANAPDASPTLAERG